MSLNDSVPLTTIQLILHLMGGRTACITCVWAGVDSCEQEKPEARKMLENAADSHTSGARFVSRRYAKSDLYLARGFCHCE
jgi:hypothetical protein